MGFIQNATSYAKSALEKQRKVMTLKEKVELLDMYHRLRSANVVAHHFKTNESNVSTIVKIKNEIYEAITAATQAGAKTLHIF